MNDQRKAIFEQRRDLMSDADLGETIDDMRRQVIDDLVAKHIPEKAFAEQWDTEGLKEEMRTVFDLDLPIEDWAKEEGIGEEEVHERLIKAADERAAKKAADFGPQIMRQIEKAVLLQTLDHLWRASRSSIFVRWLDCAVTVSAIRSTNIRARASRCSS
jgi:preprotein translocase subunit SecA